MDDFGDLYGGLDEHPSAEIGAISRFGQPCTGEANESDSEHKESEDRVIDEDAEDGDMIAESSGSSDSEDDLHIVLNDEDCRKFRPPQSVALGDGGMVAGWSDGEDEDDMVLITGADCQSKDQKCADQLPQQANGFPQGGAEGGSVAKSGYRNWHVGSHFVGFPSNARTSISGRGDSEHLMVPCSWATASSIAGIPAAAGFALPRNRTVFDMDIEEFEQKPWKHHGVDVTDYFNFGFDEESWKGYCKRMDHFRQQARMLRFPAHGSSRLNQVIESEMVSNRTLSREVARGGHGERISSIHENEDNGGMGFEMPKGRAIQVRGGFAERIPSTDIRRPRLRDSDVVIQIAMEDFIENASVPCKEEQHVEQEHTNGSVLKSEDELWKGSSLDDDGKQRFREITNPVGHHYTESGSISPSGSTFEVKTKLDCKKGGALDPSRRAASVLLDGSSSCDQVLHSSSLSDFESHSNASIGALSLEKVIGSKKKTSLSPVSGLQDLIKSDCYFSNDSGSDGTKREKENGIECANKCSASIRDEKCCSRTRLRSRAELSIHANREKASVPSHRKCHNGSDTREASYGRRTKKCDYGVDARGHLSSYKEAEILRGYKSRRDAEKHAGEKPFVRKFCRKSNHDKNLSGNQDDRDCLLKQRIVTRDNKVKQKECSFRESYRDDHGMRVFAYRDSNQSISQYESLFKENNSCLWQKTERRNERWQMEAEYVDIRIEERYQEEYVREMNGRHTACCDSEEEIFDHRFGRHVPHCARELRSPERIYKYDSNSCFDLNRSNRYFGNDAKNMRDLDHRRLVSQTYRESPIADERGWLDANSPTYYLPIPCRSSDRYVDHRRVSNTRGIQSINNNDECCFAAGSNVHHYSSYGNALDFDIDEHIAKERDLDVGNIVSSEKRGYSWLAKEIISTDEMQFRHQEWNDLCSPKGSSLYGRSSRLEKSCVSQQSGCGRKSSNDHLLDSCIKKSISERCSYTDSRDHTSVVSHIFDKGRHALAAIECREAVNMHGNDWKGKFPKRSNEVLRRSEGHNGTDQDHTVNKKLKDARHTEVVNPWKEAPPRALKTEVSCTRPTSLQVERVKGYKSENSDGGNIKYCRDESPISQDDEIEEGQLIEEPDNQDVVPVTKDRNSDKKAMYRAAEARGSNRLDKKNWQSEGPGRDNKIAGEYDSTRILETLARMEKRRERFKEPIAPKPAAEKVAVTMEEAKQQRPARKRRWGGG